MANDRMYIRCKGCGSVYFLAKCYSDGFYTLEEDELAHNLNVFFDEHKYCHGFELVYESEVEVPSTDKSLHPEKYVLLPIYNREKRRPWIVRTLNKMLKKWKITEKID